jgi:putative membrane protein
LREQVIRKEVALSPDRAPRMQPKQPVSAREDVIVLASGNLGLISFPGATRRLTMEEIEARYPTLLVDLVLHPGIGFVMVRSREQGAMVLGRGGVYLLDSDTVIGVNPLEPFGANAARHLRRTDRFENVPDIVVNSTVNARTGEVYAFEELVGSHGGLGGPQTRPFLLYPSELPLEETELVGAEAIYRQLRCWMHGVDNGAVECGVDG